MGMNTMRVFLHDLLWQQDAAGFQKRIDQFLTIAARTTSGRCLCCSIPAGIPFPQLGPQHPPDSRRSQLRLGAEPGRERARRSRQVPAAEGLRARRRRRFRQRRPHPWLGCLERARTTTTAEIIRKRELKNEEKMARVAALLPQVFAWAREANPTQPLTSGVWRRRHVQGRERHRPSCSKFNSASPTSSRSTITAGRRSSRRKSRSSEDSTGRSSARNTWRARSAAPSTRSCPSPSRNTSARSIGDSSQARRRLIIRGSPGITPTCKHQPPVWFHEVLHPDGTPYREAEADLIRKLTEKTDQKRIM